jgi:hypothetical protein
MIFGFVRRRSSPSNVDEAGGDVDVDDASGFGGVDSGGDGGDLAGGDGDVAGSVDAVLGVDDVAAPEEEVVLGLGEGASGQEKDGDRETDSEMIYRRVATLVDRRGGGAGGGAVDAHFQDPGGGDGAIVQQELEVAAWGDEAGLEGAGFVGRAFERAGDGCGAEIGVARDADAPAAEALDVVVAVPGFDIQGRAGREALAIDVFGCRHKADPPIR